MKRLIVLRHGYTFEDSEEPRRVGRNTDLTLVERGRKKIQQMADFLQSYKIDRIISSNLKRTLESAYIIKEKINFDQEIEIDDNFKEIDYGPDENKLESQVIARLGVKALAQWDEENILPEGWKIDLKTVKEAWVNLARIIPDDQTTLLVTSAGIARFSLNILPANISHKSFKINPAHLALFEKNKEWELKLWNYFPAKLS